MTKLIRWVVANAVALAILNGVSAAVITAALTSVSRPGFASQPPPLFGGGGVLLGIVVGVAQWPLLRSRMQGAHWWFIASGLGGFVGWLVTVLPPVIHGFTFALYAERVPQLTIPTPLALAVYGIAMGFAQVQVLRHSLNSNSWWWVAAQAAGTATYSLLFAVYPVLASLVPPPQTAATVLQAAQAGAISGLVGGIGYGVITGIALGRLLQSKKP